MDLSDLPPLSTDSSDAQNNELDKNSTKKVTVEDLAPLIGDALDKQINKSSTIAKQTAFDANNCAMPSNNVPNEPLPSDDFSDEDADEDNNDDDDNDDIDVDKVIDDCEIDFEMEDYATTICLFCDNTSKSLEDAIHHMETAHEIYLKDLKNKFQMDQYSFIKLVNCIRIENVTAQQVKDANEAFWLDEKYLKPKAYETWLSYDIDFLDNDNSEMRLYDINDKLPDNTENLRKLAKELHDRVTYQTMMLKQATEDMSIMRTGFQRVVEDISSTTTQNSDTKEITLQEDKGYFNSYAHFGIHHEMLSDTVRTVSYRDALIKNKNFIANKDVLDVGCGTAILSIFASQAGARSVTGIDNSDIVYNAMDIVRDNTIKNVTLIKGRLETTELPLKKYDIIISEWMGYFLLFECMLDTIIFARNNYLNEGGCLMPSRCTMSLLGYGNEKLYNNQIDFWNNVYGLNMSVMRKMVLKEPLIDIVDATHILTEAEIIADFNINVINLDYTNFTHEFNLKCTKDGKLSAFVGYFDTFFELPEPVSFGTSPNDAPTHWKQVVFFLNEPKVLKIGDVVIGKIICARNLNNRRSLDVKIEVFEQTHSYYFD